jgi:hypothetical protein
MNWIFSFIIGVLVGQEVQNIPRVKPILEKGFVKTVEYFQQYDTNIHKQQQDEEKTYYSYFYSYFKDSGGDSGGSSKKE